MNDTAGPGSASSPTGGQRPTRRVRWVPLFFGVLAPLAELGSIIAVGTQLGGFRTFLLLVAGVVVGSVLISSQARKALAGARGIVDPVTGQRLTGAPAAGVGPRRGAGRGWLMLAGVLFVAPGFASDALALLLLLPPVRRLASLGLQAAGVRWFRVQQVDLQDQMPGGMGYPGGPARGGAPGAARGGGDVVPGEVVEDPDA